LPGDKIPIFLAKVVIALVASIKVSVISISKLATS